MEHIYITFVGFLFILFISLFMLKESFIDGSGATVTLSLSDLLSLIGTKQTIPNLKKNEEQTPKETTINSQFVTDLKQSIMDEVNLKMNKQSDQLSSASPVLTDSCIDSLISQQGTDFMRYIPGKNPDDYIRKDSIPCYSCNL